MEQEVSVEQAGFRRNRGTRDQLFNLKQIIEKQREHNKDLYICFIDYVKAFDRVIHQELWSTLIRLGFPPHLVHLLRMLYENQQASVKTSAGLTEWFDIGQGVRQGCILSPSLFNIYTEAMMREALEGFEGTVKMGGRPITNLRYADDVALLAGSREELQQLVDQVNTASKRVGLELNVKKTKTMIVTKVIGPNQPIQVNDKYIEIVETFQYLGSQITNNYDDSPEIRGRLSIARTAASALTTIWKDKAVHITTKIKLLRTLIFPIATYGSETWVMKEADRTRINSFEMWCYRRILKISWKDRKTNEWVQQQVKVKNSDRLLLTIERWQLRYFGHIIRADGLEKCCQQGMVDGKRSAGRQKTRWSDNIKRAAGMSIGKATRMTEDREEWRFIVARHGRSATE